MTLDSDALQWLRYFFSDGFYPKNVDNENGTCEWPKELSNAKVLVQDILIYLRGIPMSFIKDDDSDIDINDDYTSLEINSDNSIDSVSRPVDNIIKYNTCKDIMDILLSYVKRLLKGNNSLEVLVMRMDYFGKTPKSKYVGYEKRYKNVPDYKLPENYEEISPFQDNNLLPASLNSIFKNHNAKKYFYLYMTNYILNNFKDIPVGKSLILDGGITNLNDNPIIQPPMIMTNIGIIKNQNNDDDEEEGYYIKTERLSNDYFLSHIGEADIGMFFWTWKFNKLISIIVSEDGDIILSGLLQRRRHIDPGYNEKNVILVRKKKVIGKLKISDEVMFRKKTFQEMNGDFNKKTRNYKLIKCTEYININELYQNIINNDIWYGNCKSYCKNPVETICMLLFMCGNDYVNRLPGVGFVKIWEIFTNNVKNGIIGNIVIVKKMNNSIKINNNNNNNENLNHIIYKYGINRKKFEYFVFLLFEKAYPRCFKSSDKPNNLISFLNIYPKYYPPPSNDLIELKKKQNKSIRYNYLPSIGRIRSTAANIAWCLAYFSNSHIQGHIYANPLSKSKDNQYYRYGFSLIDEHKPPSPDNVTWSDYIDKRDIYWCS
jgi:hypothetical protein